jgi:hypothetical protein
MALPLIALPSILTGFFAWWIRFDLARKLSMFLYSLSTWTFVFSIFLSFILAAYALIAGAKVFMPPMFTFAFGLIPPSAPALYASYLAFLASRRLLEMKAAFLLDVAATNKRASMLY